MSQTLSDTGAYIGIIAAALFINDEILAWLPCKSNSFSQLIYNNFMCKATVDESTSVESEMKKEDIHLIYICDICGSRREDL
jgi:hypothetical protein